MNGVREEYSIKVKQTSKGFWYCDGLQAISETTTGLANELNLLMVQVEGVLTNHNYVEPVEVTPATIAKAQKDVADKWEKVTKKDGEE